jgi:hypothetical protein
VTLGDTLTTYSRIDFRVDKWNDNRTPEDGPPDEVVESYEWVGEDGLTVTDPEIVTMLERRWAGRQNEQANGETICS